MRPELHPNAETISEDARRPQHLGVFALTPTISAAFQAISPPPNPLNGIELRSIEVADLNTDRVRFQLHLGGIVQNDISIRALSFDNATMNGVPSSLPPTSGTFKLTRGREYETSDRPRDTVLP